MINKQSIAHRIAEIVQNAGSEDHLPFYKVMLEIEAFILDETLKATGENKHQAAKLLDMNRTTLIEKLKKLFPDRLYRLQMWSASEQQWENVAAEPSKPREWYNKFRAGFNKQMPNPDNKGKWLDEPI